MAEPIPVVGLDNIANTVKLPEKALAQQDKAVEQSSPPAQITAYTGMSADELAQAQKKEEEKRKVEEKPKEVVEAKKAEEPVEKK